MRAEPKAHRLTRERIYQIVLVLIVCGFAIMLWANTTSLVMPWEQRPLRVWMLDVGQGDSLLIEMPTGERLLIDGGRDKSVLSKIGTILPPWDRRIDVVIPTHPDADHIAGLIELTKRYEVGAIIETGAMAHTPQGEAFSQISLPRKLVSAGDTFVYGDVALEVLWPDHTMQGEYPQDRNDTSLVFLLTYGQTTMLLTGDAEELVESILAERVDDVDVLHVGHHGSLTSTTWEFLNVTSPESALISVGEDNTYGHPHPVIVSRLLLSGANIFRTDLDGDVLVTSYGGEPTVAPHPLMF
jgi:competence protein ComEC